MTAQSNGNSLMAQGRIVWTSGNLFTGKVKTDDRTKQVVLDKKTGQPVIVFGFGLAILKVDPRTGQFTESYTNFWQAQQRESLTLFPGGNIPQDFSTKWRDCDTAVDKTGTLYSAREGHAGHILVACTTQIPIKYFKWMEGNNVLVSDGFKCGDYVNVQLNISAHPGVGQGKAGLYMNPSAVQFIQAGKEIINQPSGDAVFGMNAPSYAGQVEAHVVPNMPGMGQAPQMPMGAPMPQHQPVYQQPPAPPVAAPHYAVVPDQFQPQPQPQYAPPAFPQNQPYPMGAPPVQPQPQYAQPVNPGMPQMPR